MYSYYVCTVSRGVCTASSYVCKASRGVCTASSYVFTARSDMCRFPTGVHEPLSHLYNVVAVVQLKGFLGWIPVRKMN